ncbi:hypothetical protein J6590_042973 [Homalodisca vitripennis]|nr:hypothetical protein J6590_042973 [Homalodisca vitripennis]
MVFQKYLLRRDSNPDLSLAGVGTQARQARHTRARRAFIHSPIDRESVGRSRAPSLTRLEPTGLPNYHTEQWC